MLDQLVDEGGVLLRVPLHRPDVGDGVFQKSLTIFQLRFEIGTVLNEHPHDLGRLCFDERGVAKLINLIGVSPAHQQHFRLRGVRQIKQQVFVVVANHLGVQPLVEEPFDHVRRSPHDHVGEDAHVAPVELGVHVRAVLLEQLRHGHRVAQTQRRVVPAGQARLVDQRAVLQQEPGGCQLVLERGAHQRRVVILADAVGVGSRSQQALQRGYVTSTRRGDESLNVGALLGRFGHPARDPPGGCRIGGCRRLRQAVQVEVAGDQRIKEVRAPFLGQACQSLVAGLPAFHIKVPQRGIVQSRERAQLSRTREIIQCPGDNLLVKFLWLQGGLPPLEQLLLVALSGGGEHVVREALSRGGWSLVGWRLRGRFFLLGLEGLGDCPGAEPQSTRG